MNMTTVHMRSPNNKQVKCKLSNQKTRNENMLEKNVPIEHMAVYIPVADIPTIPK